MKKLLKKKKGGRFPWIKNSGRGGGDRQGNRILFPSEENKHISVAKTVHTKYFGY